MSKNKETDMEDPLTTTDHGDLLVIRIAPARLFDPALVERVDQGLRATLGTGRHLVIDVSAVRFLSSAMLGRLMLLWQEMDERRLRLALCGASPTISEILRIAGLDQRIPHYPDAGQAGSAVRKASA